MSNMFQTTSKAALIALLAAAPLSVAAQDTTAPAAEEETMNEDATGADAAASEELTDETASTDEAAPAEEESSDMAASDDAAAPAEESTDMATDDAAAPTDDSTDMATDDAAVPADGSTDMAADPAAPVDGEEMTAEAEEPAKPVEGQITMQDADTVLANDLLGATVYNGSDENVGDINDFIIGMDGTVEGVVIGVGGFLGMGEKNVAVQMASLEVVNDESGNPRLVTSATEADLKAAPEFVSADEQAAQAAQSSMETGGTGMGTTAPTE